MIREPRIRCSDVVYPQLSYEVVGILYGVYNDIGYGYHEKYYQRAIAHSLKDKGIKFKEQAYISLKFKGEVIGKFFLDFLIEDKLIVEIKKDGRFSKRFMDQVNQYLKSSGMKLALLVNFGKSGVQVKRLVNIK